MAGVCSSGGSGCGLQQIGMMRWLLLLLLMMMMMTTMMPMTKLMQRAQTATATAA